MAGGMILTKRKYAALLLIVLLLALFGAQAVEAPDPSRNVGLSLFYKNGAEKVVGAQFDLFLIAQQNAQGHWTASAPFQRYQLNFDNLTEPDSFATTLEGYVLRDDITPTQSGKTNANGFLRMPSIPGTLKHGLYLLLARPHTQENKIYHTRPVMIQLPYLSHDGSKWMYDALVNLKFESQEKPPEPQYIKRKVLKVWDDEGNENKRPQEITVQLLKDGEIHQTVTLNAGNRWRWTWPELDSQSRWLVVEKEVTNYTASVRQEGITFVITNTYEEPQSTPTPTPSPTPTPTPTPTGSVSPTPTPTVSPSPTPTPTVSPSPTPTNTPVPTLPQTGQLWWPVPVLVWMGLVLIILGLVRRRSDDYER